jgi:F420H(2)-dependent quinone reductase
MTGDYQPWWRGGVGAYPDYADYQRHTDRQIPVFVLEPISGSTRSQQS